MDELSESRFQNEPDEPNWAEPEPVVNRNQLSCEPKRSMTREPLVCRNSWNPWLSRIGQNIFKKKNGAFERA